MKYFTLARFHTKNDLRDWVPMFARYRRHLEFLRDILPENVLRLAKLPGMDDALIIKVRHDREQKVLTLILRGGDKPSGYYDLTLTYFDAEISTPDEWIMARAARRTGDGNRASTEMVYHELNATANGRIEHRLLFHPGRWFAIRCRALQWEKVDRPNRDLPDLPDRFPGGPITTLHRRRGRRKKFSKRGFYDTRN